MGSFRECLHSLLKLLRLETCMMLHIVGESVLEDIISFCLNFWRFYSSMKSLGLFGNCFYFYVFTS